MDLLSIISIIWFVSEVILSVIKRSIDDEKSDKSSLKIIWVTIVVSIMAGVFLKNIEIGNLNFNHSLFYYFGTFMIVFGIIIRWWAILTLKKSFTVNVSVSKNQKLTTIGIYNYVRHPAYTGSLISFLGLGIAFNSWISIFVIILPIFLAFLNRITVEEKLLVENFGEEYHQYCEKTKRLIPYIY